jgi:hypothetical protein
MFMLGLREGGGLWCLAIFQLYRAGQFYWWRKPEYPDPSQTLSHNVVLSTPRPSRIRTHNLNGDRH